MPKVYKNINVYDAALQRYQIVLREFDNYYISVSGGKDSSIMLQLMAQEARKVGKRFSVLYIDLEAQYQSTIQHIDDLINVTRDVVDEWYWVAMPLSLRNAVSALQPKWICWDLKDKEKWVREYPTMRNDVILCTEESHPAGWDWFFRGMEFEEFILWFAKWFNETHGGNTAAGIGIRSDESLNRFRTIISETKERYKDYGWSTRVKLGSKILNTWDFFPLYDWRTEDDWTAVAKLNLIFNPIYELMYKNGLSIHEQRLCQPYGDDQRNGLDQFRSLEPETWEKVLNRVEGVNFGNIYCRTSLLGNIKSEKPDGMSWEQYAVFLLESIGMYAPEVRDHYHTKICTFLKWYEREGITLKDIPDAEDRKLEAAKKVASWRRVARAIEKNDFWMSRLSFGETKSDVKRLFELKKKYKNIIRPQDTDSKKLKRVAEQIEKMEVSVGMKRMKNTDPKFYEYLGPVFGSRKVQRITQDRFYDDPEKQWIITESRTGAVELAISLKDNCIKNIYAENETDLITVLESLYSEVSSGVVPERYREAFKKSGYALIDKSKNFITIYGGLYNESNN